MTEPKLFAPLSKLKKPPTDAFYEHCAAGHDSHARTLVTDHIGGMDVIYQIYDWREYFMTVDGHETVAEFNGYCTGQDIISYCIDRQGVWEAEETAVQLDILNELHPEPEVKATSGIMLDFGSHIGYYSILAAKRGYQVASFDGSKENLELLAESAKVNGVSHLITPNLCWLDDQAPILSRDAEEVQLAKVDIEGAEQYALMMMADLIGGHKIKYLIFEISPTFNDTYPSLVETIAGQGYDVYLINSDKTWEHHEELMANPLATVKKYSQIPAEGRKEYVASLHQENFLFVRRDTK